MNGLIFTTIPTLGNSERSAGAYRIAHFLRKRLRADIEVADYITYWSDAEILEFIRSRVSQNKISWIGVSITWIDNYEIYLNVCKLVRENFKDLKLIVGGQDIYYKNIKADYYINGYGELAVEAALKHCFSNGKISGVPLNGGWLINAIHLYPAYPPENVDNSYEIVYEKRDFITPKDSVVIEFQRGCKFACKYCSYPLLNVKGETSRSVEDIATEFKRNYDDWGLTTYTVADETLNNSTEKLVKISEAVRSLKFWPNLAGCVRLDILPAHPEQIDLLIESRVWGQFYGVETFNHETGKIIGKGLDPEKNKQTLLDIRKRFMDSLGMYRGTVSMISGLPRESYESMENSSKWLQENWLDQSFLWFGLSIVKKQDPVNGTLKLSAFGEDVSKYGYEDMGSYGNFLKNHQPYDSYPYSIHWKNEHGTYIDAHEFAKNNTGVAVGAGFDNWNLWSLSSVTEEPLIELFKTDRKYIDLHKSYSTKQVRPEHVDKYIKRKLDFY